MPDKTDIERITRIDDVHVSSPLDIDPDLTKKKVEGEFKGMSYYAVPKDSRAERIFESVLRTLAGENKAGKIIADGKDIVSYFVPLGGEIDAITDRIGDALKSKQNKNTMKKNSPIKDVLERAFTKDGGGLFRVRDKDGNISLISIVAVVIRLALLAGFLYLLNAIGVPIEQGLQAIGLS